MRHPSACHETEDHDSPIADIVWVVLDEQKGLMSRIMAATRKELSPTRSQSNN
jgi:hypothetical protein